MVWWDTLLVSSWWVFSALQLCGWVLYKLCVCISGSVCGGCYVIDFVCLGALGVFGMRRFDSLIFYFSDLA